MVAGATPGEHSSDVLERARAVIHRARTVTGRGGDVLLIGHGHTLRAIAVAWIGLPVVDGSKLALSTATISVLGREHGRNAILQWNAAVA